MYGTNLPPKKEELKPNARRAKQSAFTLVNGVAMESQKVPKPPREVVSGFLFWFPVFDDCICSRPSPSPSRHVSNANSKPPVVPQIGYRSATKCSNFKRISKKQFMKAPTKTTALGC